MEIFVHRETKAIMALIREIGKQRYLAALQDVGLVGELKPKRSDDFFLEWENGDTYLCHQYPMGQKRRIMNVIGYQGIPIQGWERARIAREV